VENLTLEQIKARNMSMLAELTLWDTGQRKRKIKRCNNQPSWGQRLKKDELKTRGLARQEKERLTVEKFAVVMEEKEK
jgi:hypothetical protein